MIYRYTILYVADVPATIDFYHRAFGFEKAFLHDSGDYGELATGQTKLAFSSLDLMRQLGKTPARANAHAPVFELAFEVPDVRAALDHAITAGAVLVKDLQEQPWGQTISYVADRNGFLIEICSAVVPPAAD